MTDLPSAEVLQELLRFEAATGKLYWRMRSASWFERNNRFSPDAAARMWNGRNAGRQAFSRVSAKGYCVGCVLGQQHLAHRIIWKMMHGIDPETVDHINGKTTDNRLANLRNVSMAEQSRNKSTYKSSQSGVAGVTQRQGKWKATIYDNGRSRHLGLFAQVEEAIAARKSAERLLGYHKNHGRTNRG